ncbi:MAG: ECF transporter S component [Lachnospiraceae bacterium]|nr:ECF transporter S component [Lachnospiraceae bacterium]
MNTKERTRISRMVIMALMIGILLLMAFTPLGYLNIGPLALTFNMIPVAICAIVLGPSGGAAAGAVFGLTSFLQCIGIGGLSAMGAALFEISPVLAFIQRFFPRLLFGLLVGFIFRGVRKAANDTLAGYVAGFFAAFLNTLFFMLSLVFLFGNTEYVQNLIGGRNIILFICAFVGIQAVFEMLASTVLTGTIALALNKAGFVPRKNQ